MTARDRIVMIVISGAVLLGGFWFFALVPQRKDAAALRTELAAQQQRLQAAQASASQAQGARLRYDADYAAVAALGQAVPEGDDVPSLIVQVNRAADRERVDFRSLALDSSGTSAAPAAPAPAPAPTPAPGADAGTTGSSGASSDGDPATPAPATQAAAATLPPGASVGAAGFPTMPFTFAFVGSFFRLEDFLHRLDQFTSVRSDGRLVVSGRLLSVDSFDLKAAPAGFPRIAASVHATAYVLPPDQGLTAGATVAGPDSGEASTGGAPADGGSGGAPATATAAASLTSGGAR